MKTYKTNIDKINLVREKTDIPRARLIGSRNVEEYARQLWHGPIDITESVYMILLNNANNTIGYAHISSGGITASLIDTRIVCNIAITSLATAVIMVHNHPSGTLKPSRSDILITEKLRDALKMFDIKLLDHVILTEDNYTSLADENLM